jgi:hypothetical protein
MVRIPRHGSQRLELCGLQSTGLPLEVPNPLRGCALPVGSEVTLRKIVVLSQLPTHSVLRDDYDLARLAFG